MRRALGLVVGVVLALALMLSPLSDSAVGALARQRNPEVRSVRVLNYESPGRRELTTDLYRRAITGTPEDVTSLYVMGSSEFGVPVEQNPSRWLQANANDFDMYESGRGYQQSLYHAIELAAVEPALRSPKVALLVSPQWFTPGGIKAGAFQSVFSYHAWHAMLDNPRLPAELRQRVAERTGELMPELCTLRADCSTTATGTFKEIVDTPYTAVSNRMAVLRETYKATDYRKAVSYTGAWSPGAGPMSAIDWEAQRRRADEIGRSRVTNNPYGLDDGYFDRRIREYETQLVGQEKGVRYTESTEYDDLQLFLDVAKALGVEVLLVSMPVNGPWSDHTGLPVAERTGEAARVRDIAGRNGVKLVDLTTQAYTPYYFFDTIHLGWRGWLDVTEACWRFARA